MAGVGSLDVRIFWPSTVASIPAGWSRDTSFDDRYIQSSNGTFAGSANSKGSGTDVNGNHTHTAVSHGHTGDAHTHNISAGNSRRGTKKNLGFSSNLVNVCRSGHKHISTPSVSGNDTYPSIVITPSDVAHHPLYRTFLVIKPDTTGEKIPDGAVVLSEQSSHTGFSEQTWSGSFIRPSDTGADADATVTGGDSSHIHNTDHAHTANGHGHTSKVIPAVTIPGASGSSSYASDQHHNVSLNSTSIGSTQNSTADMSTSGLREPKWYKLIPYKNTSLATQDMQTGFVLLFVGTGSIPTNYDAIVASYDRQIKFTSVSAGDVGTTGGSNTHTHVSTGGHTHTHASGHTHTANALIAFTSIFGTIGGTTPAHLPFDGHIHLWTVATTNPGMDSQTVTYDSSGSPDTRYFFRTGLFVTYTEPAISIMPKPMNHYRQMRAC